MLATAHGRLLDTFTSPGPTFVQTGVNGEPLHRLAPAASNGSNDTRGCPFTPVCAKVGLGKVLGSPEKGGKSFVLLCLLLLLFRFLATCKRAHESKQNSRRASPPWGATPFFFLFCLDCWPLRTVDCWTLLPSADVCQELSAKKEIFSARRMGYMAIPFYPRRNKFVSGGRSPFWGEVVASFFV